MDLPMTVVPTELTPFGQLLPHEASHATDLLPSRAKCLFSTHSL